MMNSLKPLDITASSLPWDAANDAVFPVITRKDKNKRRVLVSRAPPANNRQNVPAPGHEYDYRRTPDPGRVTPRKSFHGQIRPAIPPDTADLEALRLNLDDRSPTPVNYRTVVRERLDVSRCPTPMLTEEIGPSSGQLCRPQDTARTAWTSGTNNMTAIATEDGDTSHDLPSRFSANTRPSPAVHRRTIPKATNKEVTFADAERECVTPAHSIPLDLTAGVLNYYYQRPVDKDQRIVRWIADCEEKSRHLLPSHLPNITIKPPQGTVSVEEP